MYNVITVKDDQIVMNKITAKGKIFASGEDDVGQTRWRKFIRLVFFLRAFCNLAFLFLLSSNLLEPLLQWLFCIVSYAEATTTKKGFRGRDGWILVSKWDDCVFALAVGGSRVVVV